MRKPGFQPTSPGRKDASKDRRRARQGERYHIEGDSLDVDHLAVSYPARHGSPPAPEARDLYAHIQQLGPSSAKGVYLEGARTLLRDSLQATWGRIQQHEEREYERLVEAATFFRWWRSQMTTVSRDILEEFEGFVDQFDGEVAHLTLKTESGETFYGQYPTAELMARGIRERRQFKCRTVDAGTHVTIELEAVPEREVSADRERAIEEQLQELLGDDDDSADAP